MSFLIKKEKLIIQYVPGNGAWTYHVTIPHTKNIKDKWGDLKVSGSIDDFAIKNKNLAPLKNSEKRLALNAGIRKAINKSGGDIVMVTLILEKENKFQKIDEIMDCFKDAAVLGLFNKMDDKEQAAMLQRIGSVATEDQKATEIIQAIKCLENLIK